MKKKLPNTKFCQYSNDNPFRNKNKFGIWTNYLKSIKYFDIHFSFRKNNIQDYINNGSINSNLLQAYFLPDEDYNVSEDKIPNEYKCDVVFAGHYEDDGRLEILEIVCEMGYKLKLYGGGWDKAYNKLKINSPLKSIFPIYPVTGDGYRYAICGAKIALCFLSKINDDTYTRRNFQIPAMKIPILCEYTDDLASMFEPNTEAFYFKDKNEFKLILKKLLDDQILRNKVAQSAYSRVYKDGHDVKSRMKYLLKVCNNIHINTFNIN